MMSLFRKNKKQETSQMPQASEMTPQAASADQEDLPANQDLIEYLQSLPDVEDHFPPFEDDAPVIVPEKTETDRIADFIRERTRQSQVTSQAVLKTEFPQCDELLSSFPQSAPDIACINGEKDRYYYCSEIMTAYYASIAAMIEDKNLPRTIAEIVRERCAYPAATPYAFFMRDPFRWTKPQLERAVMQLNRDGAYSDIVTVNAFNGERYFYSSRFFSEKYGKALADYAEEPVE